MNNTQCFTKITNKDLERLIVCSINTKASTFLPTAYEQSWLEALKNKELEIEGYERSGWIKFDPDDPKTFPPKDINTLVHSKYGNFNVMLFSENEKIIKEYWVDFVTHWRPLPKPPVKEESNEAE